jgi:hypothetical protein
MRVGERQTPRPSSHKISFFYNGQIHSSQAINDLNLVDISNNFKALVMIK